jgi:hypothetical protein
MLKLIRDHPMNSLRLRSELPANPRFSNDSLLELIQALGWTRTNDNGIAILTTTGEGILALGEGRMMLRRALLDYVEANRPPWIMLALDGRKRMLSFAPIEFGQSMSEAYLAEGYDDEVVAFWDRLAAIARGQKDASLSAIGRHGERLSLRYEKERTGRDPQWRSIESNADGYDVMSIVSAENFAQRQIEVKTTTVGISGTLHLTRNEWDATVTMRHHAFHLWNLKEMCAPKLAVISRDQMSVHVPNDAGAGLWREVEVPMREFAEHFVPVEV